MEIELKENERLDDLGRKGYQIIKNTGRFCFGMDAVLLSEFVHIKKNECVADLGTGTGILPILLEAKTEAKQFKALEIQEESVDMARRSVCFNHLQDKIEIVTGDIKEAVNIFGAASFDVVTTNPPYMRDEHGLKNPEQAKSIARHEVLCKLDDVIKNGAGLLKEYGRFYMVHRPFRLSEIMDALHRYRLEPKRMRFVHPYVNKDANMVLIEAVKGGGINLKLESPLIVYTEKGKYTEEVLRMYRES